MTWWDDNKAWVIALGIPGALSAVGRILWGRLVTKQDTEITELKAKVLALETELRSEQKEHWKTAVALASLQGKLERERAASSRPPPT